MPLAISDGASLEKNKINTDSVWLTLMEVTFPNQTPVRVCLNNEVVSWSDVEWSPAIFSLSGQSETKDAEIPSVSLSIFDAYRNIIPYLDDYSGGIGAAVVIYVVNSKYLIPSVLDSELISNSVVVSNLPLLGGVSLTPDRCTLSVSSVEYYSSPSSLCLTKNDAIEASRFEFVGGASCGLVSGKSYHISVMVYLPLSQDITAISLRYQDSEKNWYTLDKTEVIDSWVLLEGTYLEDGSVKTFTVREEGGTVSGEKIYCDNFSVKEMEQYYESKNVFSIIGCTVSSGSMINLTLGSENLINRMCPEHRYLKNHCRFYFKDEFCKYSGTETSCNRSLDRCKVLGNMLNFGGFPGIGQSGVIYNES
ncbi:MAG: hypothetical protein P9L97_05990 [Candidatus Tenebribacter davisii]|nr:hypothetical protein [Candidatus Tenebribacter davisii]